MRQSPWMKIIGEDYLELAFKFAHEADVSAELYYNDYDLELPAKRAGAVELIKKLKAAGVPIAGVGLQNHNLMDWPSAADEDATITAFSTLGSKSTSQSLMSTSFRVRLSPAWIMLSMFQ